MDLEGPPDSLASRFVPWMRTVYLAFGTMCLGFVGYILVEVISGRVTGPALGGAVVGGALLSAGGLYVLRWTTRFRIARDSQLMDGRLILSAPGWRVEVVAEDVRRVLQLKGNPYRFELINLPGWRMWIRVDMSEGGESRRSYLLLRPDPNAFLTALGEAGFPVDYQSRGDSQEDFWANH